MKELRELAPAALEAARSLREEWIRLTVELAGLESPSGDAEGLVRVLDLLAARLAAVGLASRRLPGDGGVGALLARPADRIRGRPCQLLVGHCDTVWPRGTLSWMPVVREEGLLRGPGVYDMKAGLAQIVVALEVAVRIGGSPEVTPVVLVVADEETGSHGARGPLRRLARIAERVWVLEPSLGPEGRLKTARKGVGHLRVRIHGRAAHAGLEPEEGISAVLELSHVIQRLFALNDPERGITVNVGTVEGGLRSNVVAADSAAEVDVRVLTAEDGRAVEAAIRGLEPTVPGVRLEVEGGIGRPPMERTPGNRRLWRLARELGAALGVKLEEATAGGGSDGNLTSPWAATLDGLGAVGRGAHAVHEQVDVERTLERVALLALLVLAPVLGEVPETARAEPALEAVP